jgi:hypothetical protein
MNTDPRLYPDEKYIQRLRELGVKGDINLAMLGELLPVGTHTFRADSFWCCVSARGYSQDTIKEANAKAKLLVAIKEQKIANI